MSFTVMIDPLVILLANARLWYNGSKCCLVLRQSTAVDPKHAWGLQCKFVHGTCNSQLNLPRATTCSSLSSDQQQQSILEKRVCSHSHEHSDTRHACLHSVIGTHRHCCEDKILSQRSVATLLANSWTLLAGISYKQIDVYRRWSCM